MLQNYLIPTANNLIHNNDSQHLHEEIRAAERVAHSLFVSLGEASGPEKKDQVLRMGLGKIH